MRPWELPTDVPQRLGRQTHHPRVSRRQRVRRYVEGERAPVDGSGDVYLPEHDREDVAAFAADSQMRTKARCARAVRAEHADGASRRKKHMNDVRTSADSDSRTEFPAVECYGQLSGSFVEAAGKTCDQREGLRVSAQMRSVGARATRERGKVVLHVNVLRFSPCRRDDGIECLTELCLPRGTSNPAIAGGPRRGSSRCR